MKRVIGVAAFALLPTIAVGNEPPPVDDEFLEYLADFEGQTDNWTWFAEDEIAKDKEKSTATDARNPATPSKAPPSKDVKK